MPTLSVLVRAAITRVILDRVYQLRHHEPHHCGDETCTDDHGT